MVNVLPAGEDERDLSNTYGTQWPGAHFIDVGDAGIPVKRVAMEWPDGAAM